MTFLLLPEKLLPAGANRSKGRMASRGLVWPGGAQLFRSAALPSKPEQHSYVRA